MREIRLIAEQDTGVAAVSQRFSAATEAGRLGFHFKYIVSLDRWVFDLYRDDVPVMFGRRVVLDSNLLAPFGFGVGALMAYDIEGLGDEPGYTALTDGSVRLFLYSELEQVQILSQQGYVA